MKKIFTDYNTLNEERTKLKSLDDSMKNNPLLQLKSYTVTSEMMGNIDYLRKNILAGSRKVLEKLKNEESLTFLSRFEAIDTFAETINSSSRTMASEDKQIALQYMRQLTELQKQKNELLEDVVSYLKQTEPVKKRKKTL